MSFPQGRNICKAFLDTDMYIDVDGSQTIPTRVGDMPGTALSGMATDEGAGTEYEKINQLML